MTPRDDLRIGDAERDVAMESLREHYVQGRLTREELDERLELTLSARTGGELARVSADLPGPRDPRPEESENTWGPWGAGAPWGPGGPWGPGRGHRAHAHPWGPHRPGGRRHHQGWSHHHMGHRGGPPFFPLMIPVLVAGMLIGGFGVLKFLFLAWLVMAVLGMLRRGRGRSRTRSGRIGPPAAF
ncbi:DUF1707 domain-containing protein [Streptosporangium sp. NBC_01495]|uniref:DUF1707 SHOCT-like domain-containing protein n=1 Tax=Streptosporangium sp. NBC_01495 TaxID=2903899 RepID=UPI002E37B880|nr:DUF1707 domain-containing protein [Streptosporangium sp. NBC_01495]